MSGVADLCLFEICFAGVNELVVFRIILLLVRCVSVIRFVTVSISLLAGRMDIRGPCPSSVAPGGQSLAVPSWRLNAASTSVCRSCALVTKPSWTSWTSHGVANSTSRLRYTGLEVDAAVWNIHVFYFVYRFCVVVNDLEMMMQTLITTIFSTVFSVEEGVRLLDIFEPLSAREVMETPTCVHPVFSAL